MLSITKKADYALIAMADFAERYPSVVLTRELSERRRIPVPVLRKILSTLASQDLLASILGPTGGFRMARPPAEISVAEVIAAIEGPFRLADCCDASSEPPKRECEPKPVCPIIEPMKKIHVLLEQCLSGVSIEEFASDTVPEIVTLQRSETAKHPGGAAKTTARSSQSR
jgi:Rrf2 family protein